MEDSIKDTEWWWIDYLENEMDPTLEKDLEMLLENSQEDRDSFENFRLLREWVNESDPARDLDIDARLDRLRAKVMQTVSKEKPGEEVRTWDATP